MDDDTIERIRSRMERCRRLAREIGDERAIKVLLEIAEEGEADIKRLEAERGRAD